jgi:hypothetical protein
MLAQQVVLSGLKDHKIWAACCIPIIAHYIAAIQPLLVAGLVFEGFLQTDREIAPAADSGRITGWRLRVRPTF